MIDVGRDLERMRDYVAGRLSDAELQAFEDRLARDPELVRELELSQRLREGLARLREGGQLQRAVRAPVSRRWAWAAGLAAMLAGVAVLLWQQPTARGPSVPMSATPPAAGATARFAFITMRGPSAAPVLNLPARGVVELRASRPAAPPGTRYRIGLARLDAAGRRVSVAEIAGLEPAPDGLVHAYADAAGLAAGAYELRVWADGDLTAGAEVFGFTVQSLPR